jgi:hypothetical protein
VLQVASKPFKEQLFKLNVSSPFLKFTTDLFDFENEILRGNESLLFFADYKIEWNPEFSNQKLLALNKDKDLTVSEM